MKFTSLDEVLSKIEPGGDIIDFEYDLRPISHKKLRFFVRSVWQSAYAQKLDEQGLTASYLKGVEEGKESERERVRKMIEGMKIKSIEYFSENDWATRNDVLDRLLESLT